jgi:hypothetical protein
MLSAGLPSAVDAEQGDDEEGTINACFLSLQFLVLNVCIGLMFFLYCRSLAFANSCVFFHVLTLEKSNL